MQIIPLLEAKAFPVGEAQEEPNVNPFLEKPKVGRGISDFFKGFSFNFCGMIFMRILKIFLGLAVSMLVSVILFVKPGILMKS